MIPGRTPPHPDEIKSLVAEQPGLLLSLAAFFLALFLGLAFRATFSPERITALLKAGTKKIHPSLNVQFENAFLSLSDGLFPELAVVVENVSAESDQVCWMQPQAKIDVLRLPLEISELFHGRVRLATVVVDHVDLFLRSEKGECAPPASEAASANPVAAPTAKPTPFAAAASPTDLDVTVTKRNPVENVLIRSMRVQGPGDAGLAVEFRRLRLNADPADKSLRATGAVSFPIEAWAGSSPQGDFKIHYAALPEPRSNLELTGFWREGHFSLIANTEWKSQQTDAVFEAQHLPLTPVLGLLRRLGVIDRELNGRQAWLSLKAKTETAQVLGPASQLKIDDLKVEGDLGEVEAREFRLTRLSPIEASPFRIGLRGVRLEKLFSFLDLESPSPILGDMGTFNGELIYQSSDQFELVGEHSGLQFIFANRGARELQTLSLVTGRARFQKGLWNVDVDRIRPLEGLFLGQVHIKADRPWKKVSGTIDMDELSLSPSVQKLMTGGGSLGSWSGEMNFAVDSGHLQDLHGQVDARQMLVENLSIDRAQIQMASRHGEMKIEVQGRRLRLAPPSPLLDVLKPFLPVSTGAYETERARLSLESRDFRELKWRLSPLKVGAVSLRSEGSWNEEGLLAGEITKIEGREERKWLIKGTRASPKFEVSSP
jgi:hypothetical protein